MLIAARARHRLSLPGAEHTPIFYGAAKQLQSITHDIVIEGPAGTGKTFATLYLMHQLALKYPGFRGLIGRKTRMSLNSTTLVTYERFILGYDSPIVAGMQRRYRQSYRYPNGSEIDVGGLDPLHIGKVLSAEYDFILIAQAEEINRAEYEILTTRLRSGVMPYEMIILDVNPAGPMHWLKQMIDAGTLPSIKSVHEDNPTLYDHELAQWTDRGVRYLERLDKLTGVRHARLRKGLWLSPDGAVYTEFDPEIHLVTKEIPLNWPRIRGIDFGFSNPFVCLWAAYDPTNDNLYVYREIYYTNRIVDDHAKQINALSKDEKIVVTVADHDAEDRATLLRNGIETEAAYKSISIGIDAVKLRLRNASTGIGGLFFLRDLTVEKDDLLVEEYLPASVLDEIESYTYPKRDHNKLKELPIDKDNHGLDAIRYIVCYVDDIGKELEDQESLVVTDDQVIISGY